jgi:hypothetical protein
LGGDEDQSIGLNGKTLLVDGAILSDKNFPLLLNYLPAPSI